MRRIAVFLVPLIFLFCIFTHAQAQTGADILVDVIPPNPAPGESVTVNISSYTLDVNSSKTTWVLNGKNVLNGTGQKSYTFTAPAAGLEATLTIRVGDIETKVVVRPNVMVVLWQADDSYVPPFYKGRALPAPDSSIKIVAMPEVKVGGAYLNPKNITYYWRKDFTNDEQASGYGKNFFAYVSDYLDASNFIEVNAVTTDQKYSSTASINVPTFQPKVLFYKNEDGIGTRFENAVTDGHTIVDKEIIFAAPFFISPKDIRNPRLIWNWSINGGNVTTEILQKNLLPLQVQSGVSGTSTIKLDIENMDKVFQTATKEINVQF